ncbi:MAG: hypothetical protein M0Q38_12375 [Bacteroidales bacterium]|nr:hypothetical protein [Bacteroidales bacterium]
MQTFLKHNLWSFLWGILIIVLTMLPGKVFPRLPVFLDLFQPDKLIHIFIFGVYVYLQIRGFSMQGQFPFLQRHAVILTLLIGIFLGGLTEILQELFVPMRRGDIFDFIAMHWAV